MDLSHIMTVSHQRRKTIQFSQCHSKPMLETQSAVLEFVADVSSLTPETNTYSFIRCCTSLVRAQEFIPKEWCKTACKRSRANYCQSLQRFIVVMWHLTRQTFHLLSIIHVWLLRLLWWRWKVKVNNPQYNQTEIIPLWHDKRHACCWC